MQSRFQEMQSKMKTVTVIGTAGGDMVRVEMNGEMRVTNVTISPEVVDPNDVAMLEDLVLAACTNASNKIKDKLKEEVTSLTGGIDLPPEMLGM